MTQSEVARRSSLTGPPGAGGEQEENQTTAAQNYDVARDMARKYVGAQGVQIRLVDFANADFLARTSRLREAIAIGRPTRETALRLTRQGITSSLLEGAHRLRSC